jgi:hypothetical protein
VRHKTSSYIPWLQAHPFPHPDKISSHLNTWRTRQQWSRWRPDRNMKWWRQNTDDTVHEHLKGQLILLPIGISLSEEEEWRLEKVSAECKSRNQEHGNRNWLAKENK